MRFSALAGLVLAGGFVLSAGLTISCTPAPASVPPASEAGEEQSESEVDLVTAQGGAGGSGTDDPSPAQLTGLPGIDRAQELELKILDARGTGRLGGRLIPPGVGSTLTTGEWLLSDEGSEYEITLQSSFLPDGIIRLVHRSAFLVEEPQGSLPRFRVFGGQASFYLRHLAQGTLTILTPAGPLVTKGAVFSVSVSPDFQVLVTCREGAVYLTGRQNAVAMPGQVLVADRLGRGRVYTMTPNESLVFSDRWLKIMTEEAVPVLTGSLPRRLVEWKTALSLRSDETTRFLALWFREARSVLGSEGLGASLPAGSGFALETELRSSVWPPLPEAPGLLGELP